MVTAQNGETEVLFVDFKNQYLIYCTILVTFDILNRVQKQKDES